jgi:chaperonin GroEL (HSP60 family)
MMLVTAQQQQQYLAQSIVREGMKYVVAGHNPMDLKRGY